MIPSFLSFCSGKENSFWENSLPYFNFQKYFYYIPNLRHVQEICDNLARIMKEMHGLDVDPLTDIAICCGQSEAFAAAMFACMSASSFPLHD